jgi:hypothetical protein
MVLTYFAVKDLGQTSRTFWDSVTYLLQLDSWMPSPQGLRKQATRQQGLV